MKHFIDSMAGVKVIDDNSEKGQFWTLGPEPVSRRLPHQIYTAGLGHGTARAEREAEAHFCGT
ncbi:MAG: hypothetical protein MRJ92_04280 [Nitrospira sp.]|nr:hypothetical protein [Nitrospira sp.]